MERRSSHPETFALGDSKNFPALTAKIDVTHAKSAFHFLGGHVPEFLFAMRADRGLVVFDDLNHFESLLEFRSGGNYTAPDCL